MPRSRQVQKNADIVVFEIVRDSSCAECGVEYGGVGGFAWKGRGRCSAEGKTSL
jgi:hypothetical protein